MERVLILGCAGAGKSVLARRLGEILSLPVIHLDRHYWRSGWVKPDEPSWIAEAARLTQQPSWIMDGNFSDTLPARLRAADTVIHLDFPAWLCLVRLLRRWLFWFGRTRDDMPPGCPEKLDWSFLKEAWHHRRDYRPRLMAMIASFSGRLVVLTGPRDVAAFAKQLQAG